MLMALATSFSTVVFPALGGDTIRPRWPKPIGAIRLSMRVDMIRGKVSKSKRTSGKIGVRRSKLARFLISCGFSPFTASTRSRP